VKERAHKSKGHGSKAFVVQLVWVTFEATVPWGYCPAPRFKQAIFSILFLRDKHFVIRKPIFSQIETGFHHGRPVALCGIGASGMGDESCDAGVI
jgi:hypothetical protein